MADNMLIPPGYKSDARIAIFLVAVIGEMLQGGLFFGWNALAIMIKDLGNYSDGCLDSSEIIDDGTGGFAPPPYTNGTDLTVDSSTICKSQESKLALLWTIGIFALNCGPVLMGFVLDYLGPKFTAILGCLLNMLGLILFGVSSTSSAYYTSSATNAFFPAAIILGLGNVTFHLAQFHISALFPRKRGLVSSVFVAGFTGSGIVMYLLLLIFQAGNSTQSAYRGVLIGYSGICALFIPLYAWMMPNDSFRVGHVYLLRNDWKFDVLSRSDMQQREYRRGTALQDFVAAQQAGGGLIGGAMPDSSDPVWSSGNVHDAAEEQRRLRQEEQSRRWGASPYNSVLSTSPPPVHGTSFNGNMPVTAEGGTLQEQNSSSPYPTTLENGETLPPESLPLPPDVAWGPLVFEARRFVELRKKTFKEQFLSTESFGMGVFYTLNVFFLQFYLGTQRLQLDYKGDVNNSYSNFGNVIVAFAFVTIPIIGWLLDKKGYAMTLGSINALAVLTSVLQALPMLWIQSITLVVWMVARFFMYSSYFAIFGGMFGFRNFGRLVAIDNTFNGLFGLLQYPLTYLAIHSLDGNFTAINITQVIVLLPLFVFCWYMGKWEKEDLVPIRPLEGEELPMDMVGPRERKKLPELSRALGNVHLPHIELPGRGHRTTTTSSTGG